jgi:hypothetical protein
MASSATRLCTAPSRSKRAAPEGRNSGSSRGPSTSSNSVTGSAGRKTDPHQNCVSSAPPATGPIRPPREKLAVQMPIATVRRRRSVNMVRIRASVEGISEAPARPISRRAPISCAAEPAKAAASEAPENTVAPIRSTRRRPIRSPSAPIARSEPATRKT